MTTEITPPPTEKELMVAWREWYEKTRGHFCLDGGKYDGAVAEYTDGWYEGRQAGYVLGRVLAVRCWSGRLGLETPEIDELIRRCLAFIRRRQAPDGRLDLGGAYSPNEVGFTLPALAMGWRHISQLPGDPLADVCASLKEFLLLGAEAVLRGDAYTANHRWTAAAAPLAAVHALWPDQRYLAKIENYLADGFDINEDGCWYEERSPNYNRVANSGIIVLADALGRPELLDVVRRNLDFTALFLQPNGEMDSSFSHRQDRGAAHCRAMCYAHARRIAQHTQDGRYTALARLAWLTGDRGLDDLTPLLFDWDRDKRPLPPEVAPSTDFEKFLPASGLARIRHGEDALTLAADAGNHFYDSVLQQWGGPRLSDDWFHLHHGDLVLQTIHLAAAGMTNIQPQTLAAVEPGHYRLGGLAPGWTHTLHFRPGRPKLQMVWNWRHDLDVKVSGKVIDLQIKSASESSLIVDLIFWFRPGVEVREGDGAGEILTAGEKIALRGNAPVVVKTDRASLKITGLPPSEHNRFIGNGPSIPSGIATQCGALFLGMRFPVDLALRIELL
jgi:hypothetical protein